jgi:hypothetical protein
MRLHPWFAKRVRLLAAAGAFALSAAWLMAVPPPAVADSVCGVVFTVNTRNQLMTLGRTQELLADNNLLSLFFGDTVFVRSRRNIAGLAAGESLVGIDFRPFNGMLYGVGRIGTQAVGQLYTIDPATAQVSPVGPRAVPLNGMAFGVDFNPVPDRLRLVSDARQNIRINPDTGAVAGTDTDLAYAAAGDPNSTRTPRVVAVAYTNPDNDAQTNTVLHNIDVARADDPDRDGDVLTIQVPPNAGTLNTVGSLRIDVGDFGAFDIGPRNEALAALQPAGSMASSLYAIDLASGEAMNLGRIGRGELITGLAIGLGPGCD